MTHPTLCECVLLEQQPERNGNLKMNDFNLSVDSDVEETVDVNFSAGQGTPNEFLTPYVDVWKVECGR